MNLDTIRTTTAALGGVAVLQTITALRADDQKHVRSNALGATVCTVAYLHYEWMRTSSDVNTVTTLRYSDWFITLPLLFFECVLLSGIDIQEHLPIILLCISLIELMLVMGRLSITDRCKAYKQWLLLSGFICLGICVTLFLSIIPSFNHTGSIISIIFIASWFAYGVFSFRQNSHESSIGFNILDLLNKAGLGMIVALLTLSS
jgi:bacteriorhodopsin